MRPLALLALTVLAGCIDFDQSKRVFCEKHPGQGDCPGDAGVGGGGASGAGGGSSGGGTGGGFAGGVGGGGAVPMCSVTFEGSGGANPTPATGAPIGATASNCPPLGAAALAIYVSPTGSDTSNDGGLASPLATIGAGLAAASKLRASEVRVCTGVYRERVVMTDPAVSLLGGIDCSSGQRVAAGCFDPSKPSGFPADAGTLKTVIVDPGGLPNRAVSTVSIAFDGGAPDGGYTLFDTFTVVSADAGTETHAVEIAASPAALPMVSNNLIVGGSARCGNADYCNTGLLISGGSPMVRWNFISGGAGAGDSSLCVSCGVVLAGATSPALSDNVLEGGSGRTSDSLVASTGLWIAGADNLTGPLAVRSNDITGGTGNCGSSSCIGALGVYITSGQATDVELLANQISGTTFGARAEGGETDGIRVDASSVTVRIAGNKISSGLTKSNDARLTGVELETEDAHNEVINNMIYAGDPSTPLQLPPAGLLIGFRLSGGDTQVLHNAIVTASAGTETDAMLVGHYDFRTSTTLEITDNILASNDPLQSIGVALDDCPSSELLTTLRSNLFAGVALCGKYTGNLPCAVPPMMIHPDTLETAIKAFGLPNIAQGNLQYTIGCPASEGCACRQPCTDSSHCEGELFGGWDAGSSGLDELFTAGQWNLEPNPAWAPPSCGLVHGFDDTATVTSDIYGNTRTAPPTVGPIELDEVSCIDTH